MKKMKVMFALVLAALGLVAIRCTAFMKKDDMKYGVIRKVGDKLYEVTFDRYEENEEEMIKRMDKAFKGTAPGCTSIWKDGMLMRNLDWYLKDDGVDVCELVVHTTANEGRYATIGVCFNPNITDETYDSVSEDAMKTLPFMLVDGMNSQGLMFSQNVCPEMDGISNTYGTNPDGKDLPYYMIGRQLLDHCANVDEAIKYLQSRNIYMNAKENGTRMESHFLIADKNRAVVIEFVNNQMVVLEQKDLPYDQMFITNHYLFNGGENTGHGMGFERDEIVKAGYDAVVDWKSGMNLLKDLRYSKAYTLPHGKDFWYSEYYVKTDMDGKEYDFNCNTPKDDPDFLRFIESKQKAFDAQDNDCWHSNHSSVYNSADGTLRLVVREDFDHVYTFKI